MSPAVAICPYCDTPVTVRSNGNLYPARPAQRPLRRVRLQGEVIGL